LFEPRHPSLKVVRKLSNSLASDAKEKIQRHKGWSKTVTAGEKSRGPLLTCRPRDPTRRSKSPSAISLTEIQVK